jgi:iron complex transport system permease protein
VLVCLGLILVSAASLAIGTRQLGLPSVWHAVLGDGTGEARAIVLGQRLPRTIVGLLGGAALAVAGVVIQGHTRNPLADPGLLGVTAGASLAVVTASVLAFSSPLTILGASVVGALAATVAVAVLGLSGSRRHDASPTTLVLAGSALSTLLGAATSVILLTNSAAYDSYRFWTVGSLAGIRDPAVVLVVAPVLVVGLVLALVHARSLDVLSLGDDSFQSLGRHVLRTRFTGLAIVTLLVAGATALVGSLGFVGLLAPHAVRSLTGPRHASLIPFSAVVGAGLTVAADTLGRLLVRPAELPVGVVLAVVGAPIFIGFVLRLRRAS